MRKLWICLVLLAVPQAGWAKDIYKWINKAGVLTFTDRLADVPEPYYSMYLAREKAKAEAKAKQEKTAARSGKEKPAHAQDPAPAEEPARIEADEPPSGPPIWQQEEAKRKYWQAEVARWRETLLVATSAVADIDAQIASLRSNALLAVTPPVMAKIKTLEEERKLAVDNVNTARTTLLDELPARAKKEGVPYKWLL